MATTYTQTDNYGLDLYGDNDPADLRDGHNANMRVLDAKLKEQSDGIAQNKTDIAAKEAEIQANATAISAVKTTADAAAPQATTYTKTETDSALALKADQATTYTKTETDSAIALKADQATTYTKTEVDSSQSSQNDAIALKADQANTYSKAETDSLQEFAAPGEYLFGHFSSMDEKLYIATSNDGINFEETGFVYTSPDGTVRDPSIAVINGNIWCAHTLHNATDGSEQYMYGLACFDMGFNLLSHQIITPNIANGDRAWAPEFFQDPQTNKWYILASLRISGGSFHPYIASFDNPSVFTQISPNSIGGIDWSMQYANSTYYLLGGGSGYMTVYSSSSINGSYTLAFTMPTAPGGSLEGFTAIQLKSGNWRIWGDGGGFTNPQNDANMYYWEMSPDFSKITLPYTHATFAGRHGTIVRLSQTRTQMAVVHHPTALTVLALNDQTISSLSTDYQIVPWDRTTGALTYGSSLQTSGSPVTAIAVREPGLYVFSCSISMKNIAVNVNVQLGVSINGSFPATTVGADCSSVAGQSGQVVGGFTLPMRLNQGDIVRLGLQNKGSGTQGSCLIKGGPSFMSLVRVG